MYRDRRFGCPQCGESLVQYDARDKWRCAKCGGVLVAGAELERELGEQGRELVLETRTGLRETRPCPYCHEPMTGFWLDDVSLDRCDKDGLVWFDRGELGRAR